MPSKLQHKGRGREGRIFTPLFCILFVANFMFVTTYYLLFTTMARFAIDQFACSGAMAGLASSAFLIGAVIGRLAAPSIVRHVGFTRPMLAACIIMLAASVSYFGCVNVAILIVVRLVHGFTFGMGSTSMSSLVIESLPFERIGEGSGYYALAASLGTAIGPTIGLLVAGNINHTVLFGVCTGLSVVALACALGVNRRVDKEVGRASYYARLAAEAGAAEVQPEAESGAAEAQPEAELGAAEQAAEASHCDGDPAIKILSIIYKGIDPLTWKVSMFICILGVAYAPINSFVESYTIALGIPVVAPFVFITYAAALLLSRPVAGILMDRHGANVVLYPSIAFMAIGLFVCAFATTPAAFILVGVCMALGFGTSLSSGQALIAKLIGGKDTALAVSTYFLLCDLGCGFGPMLLGGIATSVGFRALYIVCGIIALADIVYYHFVHGRKAHRA